MRGGLLEIAVFAVLSNQIVAVYLWEEKSRLYVLRLCMNRKEGVVPGECALRVTSRGEYRSVCV